MSSSSQEGRGRTTQSLRVDVALASATWPVIASGAEPRLQLERHELVARRDRQLREDPAQVVIDGALAEEQLRRDFPVGGTACDEACDLDLLGRQLVDRARIPLAGRLAAGAQLAVRALGPWRRARCARTRPARQPDGREPPPRRRVRRRCSPNNSSVRARSNVRRLVRRRRERPPEVAVPRGGPRQQRAAARDERQRPRRRVGPAEALEPRPAPPRASSGRPARTALSIRSGAAHRAMNG